MNILHGFFYLTIININDGRSLLEIKDLTYNKESRKYNIKYLHFIKEEGITYHDMAILNEPSSIKVYNSAQNISLIYNFCKGRDYVFIVVSQHTNRQLFKNIEKSLLELDQESIIDEGNPYNEEQLKEKALKIITRNFMNYLLPSFLIPQMNSSKEKFINNNLDTEDESLKKIIEEIDGSWNLQEIYESNDFGIEKIQKFILKLWINDLIYFRFKFYKWDTFEWIKNVDKYFDGGSPENLLLVNKFNTNKIIRVLLLLGKNHTYKYLFDNIDLTKTKLNLFLTELIKSGLIQKKPLIPEFYHITEDMIPLLTLQGFKEEDFDIFEKLEEIYIENICLDEISLRISINPYIIKTLLDKYKIAKKIIN